MSISKQEKLIKQLEAERGEFKKEMLRLSNDRLYDRACEIAVKEDIKGYIESEQLPPEYTERLLSCENALDTLYVASLEADISNSGDIFTLLRYVCEGVSENRENSGGITERIGRL